MKVTADGAPTKITYNDLPNGQAFKWKGCIDDDVYIKGIHLKEYSSTNICTRLYDGYSYAVTAPNNEVTIVRNVALN